MNVVIEVCMGEEPGTVGEKVVPDAGERMPSNPEREACNRRENVARGQGG